MFLDIFNEIWEHKKLHYSNAPLLHGVIYCIICKFLSEMCVKRPKIAMILRESLWK